MEPGRTVLLVCYLLAGRQTLMDSAGRGNDPVRRRPTGSEMAEWRVPRRKIRRPRVKRQWNEKKKKTKEGRTAWERPPRLWPRRRQRDRPNRTQWPIRKSSRGFWKMLPVWLSWFSHSSFTCCQDILGHFLASNPVFLVSCRLARLWYLWVFILDLIIFSFVPSFAIVYHRNGLFLWCRLDFFRFLWGLPL